MARILIVEDNSVVMSVLCRLIATLPEPHEVLVADEAYKALELLKSSPPDLVILDVQLARATTGQGFMVYLQSLRRSTGLGDIPVIVNSGQPLEKLEGLRGAYPQIREVFQKPAELMALRAAIVRWLPPPVVVELRPRFDNPAILRCLAG